MKLEKAYSFDVRGDITPTQADIQFQQGDIKSKFNFKCPDKNCDAQVTCANLDKPKYLRKRNPYYKVIGEHSTDCLIAKDIENQPVRKQKYNIYRSEDKIIEDTFKINLQPPSTKKTVNGDEYLDNNDTLLNAQLNNNQASNTPRQSQPSKTLSSIVDSFLNNESIDIQLPEIGSISIKDLFVKINEQDIVDFSDEWYIYYGKAWINKKDNGYSVVFENELISGETKNRPSFFISKTALERSGFVKFNQQKMIEIANKKPKQVFLLSKIAPYLKDNKYINFECEAPNFMDYRL